MRRLCFSLDNSNLCSPDFDAGTYLVKKTIFVPAGTIIVGEMFSVIMGSGAAFQNQGSPTPVLRVRRSCYFLNLVEPSANRSVTKATWAQWRSQIWLSLRPEGRRARLVSSGTSRARIPEMQVCGMSTSVWEAQSSVNFLVWTRTMVHALQGTSVQASTCPTSSQNLAACATAFLGFHITNTGSGYFEVRRPCRSRCGALFTSIHNRTCGSGTPTTILTIPPKRGSTHSALAVSLSSPRRALFGLSEPRLNITYVVFFLSALSLD